MQDETEAGIERSFLLFSYGTLRDPDVQTSLFGRLLDGEADAIPGWQQRMIKVTDPDVIAKSGTCWHPMVERSEDPGDAVEGTVFRLTQADIASADAYEVDYVRREVRLRSGTVAFIYGDPTE
ncbi:gamma-glutamylcyclotransferase family protein [Novosphingobium sp. BL-8H]|uniref:gamma-glutamylcyclotransferase family protein n=1 Tax=Novosphingobium sp. BL-8H TaxID=3127640 RepID=UPI0037570035